MLLKDMRVGQQGRIMALRSEGLHCRRLCEMGFLPGTEFSVIHRAPLGYPLALKVRGYEVIIGKTDAATVEVEAQHEINA
ncbi:MAG: ferrous iron transport protein A [Succinivibrionaceae bacterium]|nr:ferrous iron transport protein A [Succinivibrionaceae bacterium]